MKKWKDYRKLREEKKLFQLGIRYQKNVIKGFYYLALQILFEIAKLKATQYVKGYLNNDEYAEFSKCFIDDYELLKKAISER